MTDEDLKRAAEAAQVALHRSPSAPTIDRACAVIDALLSEIEALKEANERLSRLGRAVERERDETLALAALQQDPQP